MNTTFILLVLRYIPINVSKALRLFDYGLGISSKKNYNPLHFVVRQYIPD